MRLIDADDLDCKIVEMTREPAYQHTGEDWLNGLCMAMEAVNEAPTVEAVEVVRCNWIRVSERLPEDGCYVLAIVSGRVENVCLDRAIELAEFSMDEGWILEMWPDWENPTVTHWMPLPEPPKEDHHET